MLTALASDRFKLAVIQSPENLGFSDGCNLGKDAALKADPEYVWFLNNDVEVDKAALEEMLKLAQSYPELGAISSAVCYLSVTEHITGASDSSVPTQRPNGEGKVWYAGSRLYYPWFIAQHRFKGETLARVREYYGASFAYSPVVCGCSLFVRAAVLEQIGGFDERHFLYGEDVDLSVRIKQAGNHLAVAFDSVVFHKVSQSSGGEMSPAKEYYRIRNGYFNISKYARSMPTRFFACLTRPVFDCGAISSSRGR